MFHTFSWSHNTPEHTHTVQSRVAVNYTDTHSLEYQSTTHTHTHTAQSRVPVHYTHSTA